MESEKSPGEEYADWKAPETGDNLPNNQGEDSFDMQQRLAKIKELRRNQNENLTRAQSKQLVRRELTELKYDLETQSKNIELAITSAQQTIEDYPDVSADELFEAIGDRSEEPKLSREILSNFQTVFRQYEENHKLIESYCNLYSPEEFFEKCFGTKPEGYIEFVKRPMCVVFRCFNKNDYITADNFAKIHGNLANLSVADKDNSFQSGGALVGSTGIPELDRMVVIENCARSGYEFRDGDMMGVNIDQGRSTETTLASDDFVFRSQGEQWKVKMLGYDAKSDTSHMQLVKNSENGEEVISDIALVPKRDEAGTVVQCAFRDYNESGGETDHLNYDLRSTSGAVLGQVSVDASLKMSYTDSGEGSQILSTTNVQEINRVSEETLQHEEQHVYNSLFTPIERKNDLETIVKRSVEAGNFESAKALMIDQLVRSERKNVGIDSAARDEIIAYYKEGQDLTEIEDTLSNSDLYDYRNDEYYQQQIQQIPQRVKEGLARIRQSFGEQEGNTIATNEDDEIQAKIEQVFGEIYRKDISRWIGAIGKLEENGYSRDEIVPMLYSTAIGNWNAISRRKTARQ